MNLSKTVKIIVTLTLSILSSAAISWGNQTMYPTLPGTSIRDYSQPGLTIQGNNVYQTLPGTSIRDYSQPGFTTKGNTMYQTLPGTSIRDYSKPGWTIR